MTDTTADGDRIPHPVLRHAMPDVRVDRWFTAGDDCAAMDDSVPAAMAEHCYGAAGRSVIDGTGSGQPTGFSIGPFPVRITDAADGVLIAGQQPHDAEHPERYSAVVDVTDDDSARGPEGVKT